MPEPSGYVFPVTVDGKPRTISITADLFSTKMIRRLAQLRRASLDKKWSKLLELRSSLPEDAYDSLSSVLAADIVEMSGGTSFEDALSMFMDLDAVPSIVFCASPDVTTIEDAEKVVDECTDVVELISKLASTIKEVMESVKKALSPPDLKDAEKTEQSQ